MSVLSRGFAKAAGKGVVDMLPLSLAVLPWGILFGSLAVQRGFSWLEAQLFSGIIFGGAVQIVTVELIADNASLLTVLFSAFVISSRHFLYGLYRHCCRRLITRPHRAGPRFCNRRYLYCAGRTRDQVATYLGVGNGSRLQCSAV